MFVFRPTLGAIVIAGLAGLRAVSPAAAGEGGDEAIAACGRAIGSGNSVATFSQQPRRLVL